MTTSRDQTFIAFFTEPKEIEQKRNSEHGEVPEVFKTNEFHVTISGTTLALPNPWRPTKLRAQLYTQPPTAAEFVHRHTTETIEGESSPKFTKKATFGPLQMSNSQNEAKRTLVKVDIYLNDDLVFTTTFQLARLLWDKRIEELVQPVMPSMVVIKNKKAAQGRLIVDVMQGRPPSVTRLPFERHEVVLNFELCARVWGMISEQKVHMALCSVGFRGRWNRVYASENIKRPFLRNASTVFSPIHSSRGDLVNSNPKNPIRIELYGYRKGYPKLLGYSHVTLTDLHKPRDITWNAGPSSTLFAVLRVASSFASQTRSEVNFRLESCAVIGRGINANTGRERSTQLDQNPSAYFNSGQCPPALRSVNFQHHSPQIGISGRADSTILTPRNFKVHFPATYRSVLDEATNNGIDDDACRRTNGPRLVERLES